MGTNNTVDLDLSSVDSEDLEQQASLIETFYKQDSSQKTVLGYHWERNHLMLDGQQWITFDGNKESGGSWRSLKPTLANDYIPRPVTNYMFDAYQTLKSYLLKNKPRSVVRPNTQTQRDKSAAKIAELVLECNYERLKENYNDEYAASCLITYGTVFKKDYWDNSFASMAEVPKMIQTPVMDPNTGQPTGEMQEVQETDENGYPVFDSIPLGDLNTTIVEPYRIALDPLAVNLHEARWIMEYSIRPISWIVENYNKQEEGYTGRVGEVKEEKSLSGSMRRFYQLRTSAGVKGILNNTGASSSSGGAEVIENAAVVKEYYQRPSQKFPKGRLIVVASGVTIYSGASPCKGPDQGDWHPYSECRWEIVPGRFWGKSPFDDASEIQKIINSIDSILILTRKTMAVPQKMVPIGSIAPGQWTGQPGQMVFAKPGPGGEMPSTIPASGVDQTVFDERAQRVQDFKQLTGAVDVLKGDRPPGVTAASAINMLFEVATGKLGPIYDRWKFYKESSQKKQLRLVAHKYREPRPDFINMLISKNRDLTEDQIKTFIGEDLYDNCNVVIEATSSIPKLQASKNALLQENAQMGILNLENPMNRREYLSRQGIEGFDSDFSKDVKRAEWENDLLDSLTQSPDNMPIILDVDNDDIHLGIHADRVKEPSFMSLPVQIQQAYFQHMQAHEEKKAQAMQIQAMQAAAMGQMSAPPQPSPMHGQENVRKGQPVPKEAQQAQLADLQGPAAKVGE